LESSIFLKSRGDARDPYVCYDHEAAIAGLTKQPSDDMDPSLRSGFQKESAL
jgi:hypothetical protein